MRMTLIVAAAMLASTAQADVFLPEGDAGSVLHFDDAL